MKVVITVRAAHFVGPFAVRGGEGTQQTRLSWLPWDALDMIAVTGSPRY